MILTERFTAVKFDDHLQSFEMNKKTIITVICNIQNYESKPVNLHVLPYSLHGTKYLRLCNYYNLNGFINDLEVGRK